MNAGALAIGYRLDGLCKGRYQISLFQHATAQIPHGPARFDHAATAHIAGCLNRPPSSLGGLLKTVDRQVEVHGNSCKFLFQGVVQLARYPVALFVNHDHAYLLTNNCHLRAQTVTHNNKENAQNKEDASASTQEPQRVAQVPPGWRV